MKTIKVIDLLNLVYEKKAPNKILYKYCEYYFDKENNDYKTVDGLNLFEYLFKYERLALFLEVEILEDILDKKEKEFLENLVRPFKKEIISIVKTRVYHGECECIEINFNDEMDSFCLPYFSPNAMYKNMELDKEYTIEELGL